jgi:hypothetical protein
MKHFSEFVMTQDRSKTLQLFPRKFTHSTVQETGICFQAEGEYFEHVL